jgi:hypothetical protein
MAVSAGAIKAGRAYVEVSLHDRLAKGLKAAQARLEAFGSAVRNVGLGLAGVGTAALAALGSTAWSFASMGDALDDMAKRTGFSVEALSTLQFAAGRSGTSLEDLEKGVRRMQGTLLDAEQGLSTAKRALAELGLKWEDLKGLKPEEQFERIASGLAGVQDASRRAAIAQDLFGRSGTALVPMLRDLPELKKEAERLGLVIGGPAAAAAAELQDRLEDLWAVLKRTVFELGSALAPVLLDILKPLTDLAVCVGAWVRENKALVIVLGAAAAAVTALGVALAGLGVGITLLGGVVGSVATIVGVLSSIGWPVVAAVAGVVALGAALAALGGYALHATGALAKMADWLGPKFAVLKRDAVTAFGGIKDALEAGEYRLAAQILWQALRLEWARGSAKLLEVWVDLKERLLAIPIVGFLVRDFQEGVENIRAAFAWLQDRFAEVVDFLVARWREFRKELEGALALLRKLPAVRLAEWGLEKLFAPGEVKRTAEDAERLAEAQARVRKEEEELARLRGQAATAKAGKEAEGEAPGAEPEPTAALDLEEETRAKEAAKWREELAERIHRLRLEQIEDEQDRELALLNEKYNREQELARAQGKTDEDLWNLEKARELEIEAIRKKYADQAAEEAKRAAEERGRAAADLEGEIRRAEIEAQMTGLEKDLALLDLEREEAKRQAEELGFDPERIERLFDLRRQILAQRGAGGEAIQSVVGTFSAFAERIFGGRSTAERTAKAAEKTAENTGEIQRTMERGLRVDLAFAP